MKSMKPIPFIVTYSNLNGLKSDLYLNFSELRNENRRNAWINKFWATYRNIEST